VRQLIALVVLSLAPLLAEAHRDRVFSPLPDGTIAEFPPIYGRVAFQAKFIPQPASVRFIAAGRTTVVPSCIAKLIKSRQPSDVELSGSWYHSREVLPPYVNAVFYAPGVAHDPAASSHVSILFNVTTAQIISVGQLSPGLLWFGPRYRQYTQVELCGRTATRSNNSSKPTPLRGAA
jgi:hypothetical protein